MKILIVGQTPPPYGGQAIMISKLVDANYSKLEVHHLRMSFSDGMDDMGKSSFSKIWKLFVLVFKTIKLKFSESIDIIYYPPAGPCKVPIFRDVFYLLLTKWFFKYRIYHFHAGGLSLGLKSLPFFMRKIAIFAYRNPDLTIRLSARNPQDGLAVETKKDVIIPYGIEDHIQTKMRRSENKIIQILYVGVLKESKGVLELVNAASQLKNDGISFEVSLMGQYDSIEFKTKLEQFILANNLSNQINFLGLKSGVEKFHHFEKADIFCFPTYFESETFGVVLLEAMQFSLPIVATKWRGVPDLVDDEINGYLVEPKNSKMLYLKLKALCLDHDLRQSMGAKGRTKFKEKYDLKKFVANFEKNIIAIVK